MADLADHHWLWKETVNRLTLLHARVREGRDLEAAIDFARFVLWSRLDVALKPYDNSGALKVDSAFMRWKAEELQRAVCDLYAAGKAMPQSEVGHLEQITHKLDLIAARLAQVPIATAGPETGCGPNLSVITGGASDGAGEGGDKHGEAILNLPAKRRKMRKRGLG